MLLDHRVVGIIDKVVPGGLVFCDPELACDIVLKFVIVSIEMVFGDIGKDGYVRAEVYDIVELEAADLAYVPGFRVFGNLACKRIADITYEGAIQASVTADMVGHR